MRDQHKIAWAGLLQKPGLPAPFVHLDPSLKSKQNSSFALPLLVFAIELASDVDDALPSNALYIEYSISPRFHNLVWRS